MLHNDSRYENQSTRRSHMKALQFTGEYVIALHAQAAARNAKP